MTPNRLVILGFGSVLMTLDLAVLSFLGRLRSELLGGPELLNLFVWAYSAHSSAVASISAATIAGGVYLVVRDRQKLLSTWSLVLMIFTALIIIAILQAGNHVAIQWAAMHIR